VWRQHGFVFHSAEPASVMMTRWLPDNETCLLPDGASHTVGVGGFVYNAEKRELLVIREKYIPTGMAPFYKLPGGYVKAGTRRSTRTTAHAHAIQHDTTHNAT
jgi:hypothetical protein